MTKVSLVVLAAGLGSRFGGIKQLEPINDTGSAIIDFSLFDAINAGFSKVVFVVRQEITEAFRERFGAKLKGKIEAEFVCQESDSIPPEFLPTGRTKPWGTAHALLTAKRYVSENFCVINADDFYGRDSFERIFRVLSETDPESSNHSMIGYRLKNTLSDNGSVSRGECFINDKGFLEKITERKKIMRIGGHIFDKTSFKDIELSADELVSMNFWGFTPQIFDELENGFVRFLSSFDKHPESEYFITNVVDEMIAGKRGSVQVFGTDSEWMGMTYRDDKLNLINGIKLLKETGVYPKNLWK